MLFSLLLLAIVVASGVLWLGSVADARLESELALVREAGEPLHPAELAPPPVPEADNAAPLLLEVRALLEDEPASWYGDEAFQRYGEDPFDTADAFYAELADWVERNEPALERALEAAARPACRFELQWEKGIEMEFPHLPVFSSLAWVLRARAVLQTRAGDVDGAVASCARMVRLVELALREPLLIHLLIRDGVVRVALETVQGALARGRASGAALENLLSRLDALPGDGELRRVLACERAIGYHAFQVARGNPAMLDRWAPEPGLGREILLRLVPGTMLDLDAARYLAFMQRAGELAERPWLEARADWDALAEDQRDRPWYDVLSSGAELSPRVPLWRTLAQVEVDLARLGLELELQARRMGAPPASLAACEDSRRTQDRFRDAPYVFRLESDGGWVVYSVGPDGEDDGGAPFDDEHGDLVWRHVGQDREETPR